jgi:hypothetical protein
MKTEQTEEMYVTIPMERWNNHYKNLEETNKKLTETITALQKQKTFDVILSLRFLPAYEYRYRFAVLNVANQFPVLEITGKDSLAKNIVEQVTDAINRDEMYHRDSKIMVLDDAAIKKFQIDFESYRNATTNLTKISENIKNLEENTICRIIENELPGWVKFLFRKRLKRNARKNSQLK